MVGKSKAHSSGRFKRRILYAFSLLVVILIISCVRQIQSVKQEPAVGQVRLCDVSEVHDGDTLSVVCDYKREKLRLYCIDAPELGQKPWGIDAKKHLASLIGKQLEVEYQDTDKYGRTVARVRDGVSDVGAKMVLDGYAVVYRKYCPVSEVEYYTAENTAQQRRLAVWSKPGLQSQPWVWRHNQ